MKKFPSIVSDIDGVLLRGKKVIGKSDITLKYIRQPLNRLFPNISNLDEGIGKQQLPFVCLTNGGGFLEQDKADQMNKAFNFKQKDPEYFSGKNIILNFTPLRPIMQQYQQKPVLLIGQGDLIRIAQNSGLQKYITIQEYCSLYPQFVNQFVKTRLDLSATRKAIAERFQLNSINSLVFPIELQAIFMLHDPIHWEDCLQVMLDQCKFIQQSQKEENGSFNLPIYAVNDDILYADEFHLPRFAYGPFNYVMREVFKTYYNVAPHLEMYGKPTLNTYNYTEKYIRENFKGEISNFYMIGDNPKSDIRGANNKGWISILVKSGVFNGQNNDPTDPATYVVDHFYDAIKLIFKLENLPFQLKY